MGEPTTGPDPVFLRSAQFATGSLEIGETLRRLLAAAVADAGAAAGAVLEAYPPRTRALWRASGEALDPLLGEGGPVARAMQRQDEWDDAGVSLARDPHAGSWPEEYEEVLLVPLRVRGLASGAIALFFQDAAPAAPGRDRVAVLAAFAALVLENERLYESARAAEQSRDHFLAALNHEMRTPATAFILMAEMIRTAAPDALPPRLERLLHEAEEQVTQLVDVLHRVLDLGHIEEHADTAGEDIVQTRRVVTELMRRMEPAAKRKGLALALHTPRDLPPLQTDLSRFSRILLHLLSNAIKYTSDGRVDVRLERTTWQAGKGRTEPVLVVRVIDTGRGIPPGELQRIFEPFTQVDEGARTDSWKRGIGLGLPLARQLARTLGGDVIVESTPGRGTTASLLLPFNRGVGM
jgi:signal transduction histidine kinase